MQGYGFLPRFIRLGNRLSLPKGSGHTGSSLVCNLELPWWSQGRCFIRRRTPRFGIPPLVGKRSTRTVVENFFFRRFSPNPNEAQHSSRWKDREHCGLSKLPRMSQYRPKNRHRSDLTANCRGRRMRVLSWSVGIVVRPPFSRSRISKKRHCKSWTDRFRFIGSASQDLLHVPCR